ncbi:hypothetical protein G5I_03049 [Acromyrmex echinatior]|uniref:Uncharacterized protein n=1 Tax=Acromyrmex echinatior TaxID=103372 RepID=F4WBX8_ACREC|nr:hypothetical protein G5I_03049 [Acromyrmex echinatior]
MGVRKGKEQIPDNETGEQVCQLHFFLLNPIATSMNVGTTSCVDEASAGSRNHRPSRRTRS